MATLVTHAGKKKHRVVSKKEWFRARKKFLAEEKAYMRLGDKLHKKRRALPWEKVDTNYRFDGPNGKVTLAELFGSKSQLIVYHFMFAPGATQGCPHCSFWADHYDAAVPHLGQRDTSFAVISRAPVDAIEGFRKRMGWNFRWLSSGGNEFNYDFNASFTPEMFKKKTAVYNYAKFSDEMLDREGISIFYKDDDGTIYHTYSTFARGIEVVNSTYHFLDLLPKGRDEEGERGPQTWVKYHDRYTD